MLISLNLWVILINKIGLLFVLKGIDYLKWFKENLW